MRTFAFAQATRRIRQFVIIIFVFAVIHIPNFELQAILRNQPDLRVRPIALVDSDVSKDGILQVNALAASGSVVPGLKPVQALARCADIIIKSRSAEQENSGKSLLLQTACAFSPAIEDTLPGVCTLGLQGLNLESEQAARDWGDTILRNLRVLHFDGRIGFGRTPDLALLAAKFLSQASDSICYIRDTDRFMAELPVESLELPPDVLDILRQWGIRTVGKLIALGKDRLSERLGAIALKLFTRVSVQATRPLKLVMPPQDFVEEINFEGEIETAQPLLVALQHFTEQLSRRLDVLHLIVAQLNLQLGLASGKCYRRSLQIPAPTGNVLTLFRALQTHLETLRTDSPVVSVQLEAIPSNPRAYQFELFENVLPDPNQFGETLARLTALCGSDRVGSPLLDSTHKPDAIRVVTPDFNSAFARYAPNQRHYGPQLRRFRPPIPAEIKFQNGTPVSIRSDAFSGPILDSRGPFALSGNWWDATRWAREEWDVQSRSGALFRVVCSESGMVVEGVYD